MWNLFNIDNLNFDFQGEANYIYCDPIYEDLGYSVWIDKYWQYLKPNSIFCIQTDFHTCPDIWYYIKHHIKANLVSHSAWKCEWGNYAKNYPHQCFDDLLIFSNGKDWKYYPERVQVPKATAGTKLNPSGRQTKPATAWIDDVVLTTTSKERVKKNDGHLLAWQKPLGLYDRVTLPFTDEEDLILDPFMGSGSLGCWSVKNHRDYVGIENDPEVFELAKKRISLESSLMKNAEIYNQLSFV